MKGFLGRYVEKTAKKYAWKTGILRVQVLFILLISKNERSKNSKIVYKHQQTFEVNPTFPPY